MNQFETSLETTWHRQLTQWHLRRRYQALRRNAAVGFIARNDDCKALVELDKLILVVVHDERLPNRRIAIRISGFKPSVNHHGVTWASFENAVIYKDLCLKPCLYASGQKIDIRQEQLLQFVLQLNGQLEWADGKHRGSSRPTLIFPRLWASFPRHVGNSIVASGPEFEDLRSKSRLAPCEMQAKFTRQHLTQVLLPLEWVSDQLGQSTGLYADGKDVPACQIVQPDRQGNLRGYDGATEYDLFANRFREILRQPENMVTPYSIDKGAHLLTCQ